MSKPTSRSWSAMHDQITSIGVRFRRMRQCPFPRDGDKINGLPGSGELELIMDSRAGQDLTFQRAFLLVFDLIHTSFYTRSPARLASLVWPCTRCHRPTAYASCLPRARRHAAVGRGRPTDLPPRLVLESWRSILPHSC